MTAQEKLKLIRSIIIETRINWPNTPYKEMEVALAALQKIEEIVRDNVNEMEEKTAGD
jgi:hypothetical protein